jgi:hypothetical protein
LNEGLENIITEKIEVREHVLPILQTTGSMSFCQQETNSVGFEYQFAIPLEWMILDAEKIDNLSMPLRSLVLEPCGDSYLVVMDSNVK